MFEHRDRVPPGYNICRFVQVKLTSGTSGHHAVYQKCPTKSAYHFLLTSSSVDRIKSYQSHARMSVGNKMGPPPDVRISSGTSNNMKTIISIVVLFFSLKVAEGKI